VACEVLYSSVGFHTNSTQRHAEVTPLEPNSLVKSSLSQVM
jgi:hypothetical protein